MDLKEMIDKLEASPSFQKFLETGVKSLTEDSALELRSRCIREAFVPLPNFSDMGFFGNLAWFSGKQDAFATLLEKYNVNVDRKAAFEEKFALFLKEQGPNPGISPQQKLAWYSEKRAEFAANWKKD